MSNTLIKLARRFQYKLFIYASERSLNALKAKYPDVAGFDRFKNKNKYILWLEARFGENPTKEEIHPIEDCLNTLLKYYNKENGLAQKYQTSEEFRNLVKELTEGKTYKDLKVIENITIDEMEKILLASERKKEVVPTALNIDVSGDKVGKVGPWNIWLPSSRDNSVHIAGFDTDEAGNKNPKTTWCTARTMGSNLFYNYVGSPQIKFMLFYIIKNKPEGDVDYLSLGFRNGVPVLPSSNGSASVDRANQGLSSERLRKIWGKHYQAIMNMMQKKCDELDGVSPAYVILTEASKDLDKFKKLVVGHSKNEKRDLINDLQYHHGLSDSILRYLATDKDPEIREYVVKVTKDESIIKLLAKDQDEKVRGAVPFRTKDESILKELAIDKSLSVRQKVARSTNNESILKLLASDDDYAIGMEIVQKTNDESIFAQLALSSDRDVRLNVVRRTQNQNTLEFLTKDKDPYVKEEIIRRVSNGTANESMLEIISKDRDPHVLKMIISITDDKSILERLAMHHDDSVRLAIVMGHNKLKKLDLATQENLAKDQNSLVREELARRTNFEQVLKMLSHDEYFNVRYMVGRMTHDQSIISELSLEENDEMKELVAKKTNDKNILHRLAKDENISVRINVAQNPNLDKNIFEEIIKKETDYSILRVGIVLCIRNPNSELLEKIVSLCDSDDLLEDIVRSKSITEPILLMILKKAEGYPRLRELVAQSAAKHNYNSVLKILSKDQYEYIRMVVAEGATDESILREMLADQSNSNKMKQTIKNKLKSINVNIEK